MKKVKITVAQIKEKTSELEAMVNERISATDTENASELYQKELEFISSIRPKSRSLKSERIRYMRELEHFLSWEDESSISKALKDEREKDGYTTFMNNFSDKVGEDFTKDDYRKMVEIFGALGSTILEQLGSGADNKATGDVVLRYARAKKKGVETDFIKIVNKVMRRSKKQGKTPTELLSEIDMEIKTKK